jgi:hypothetical protein
MTDHFVDANKKALSPGGQAVLDAYQNAPIDDGLTAAAVLRAVADHLRKTSPWPGHIESTGVNWSSNQLFMIADELENQ